MDVVTMVLVFLLTVVVCGFVARLLPVRLPLPLLQIAGGAVLSYGFGFDVALDPDIFFLLFIPPLLFLDGWRIPKGAFFRDWRPILTLAVGLVFATVVGIGLFIEWLIPAMPLAVAFALAAILSPTDPVAVSAVAANAPIPPRLMHILEGESLLNDASGLVCFRFAVAAAVTGGFSIGAASLSFLTVAGGGLLVGLAVTWLVGLLNRRLVRRVGEEPGIQILVSLLMPFAAYLVAEHLHVSGILAAAAAGIAMHYAELSGRPLAATRMQRNAVWDMVQTSLNGIIFVMLGEQLPRILRSLPEVAASVGASGPGPLVAYVFAITVALGLLRFAWVWTSVRFSLFRRARRGDAEGRPHVRTLAVTATAGVRGAITLAGVLTLPLVLPDGSPFPARDLAIFLAMGVILLSLVIASIGLPLLARDLPELPQPPQGASEGHARAQAAEAALRRLEELGMDRTGILANDEVRNEASAHVESVYRRRLDYGQSAAEDAQRGLQVADAERGIWLRTLAAERDELYRMRRLREIDDGLLARLVREVDLMEARFGRGSGAHG
ncbi:Na+/H+ antiporter [Coralloluteibacterium stylophorae]|uniref:Na+/H+ antiporter n=1 Tax=Coralloluteibacterium stylophorae TaxID=1776034 RepID=A0AAP2CEK9_9GAMM|nr:Na+/H+ antiporter [Coralloluteibacterium stylophorae]MBS7457957.1 Na+/H+ antiporter [Coralloluteibacterium stylophorae]